MQCDCRFAVESRSGFIGTATNGKSTFSSRPTGFSIPWKSRKKRIPRPPIAPRFPPFPPRFAARARSFASPRPERRFPATFASSTSPTFEAAVPHCSPTSNPSHPPHTRRDALGLTTSLFHDATPYSPSTPALRSASARPIRSNRSSCRNRLPKAIRAKVGRKTNEGVLTLARFRKAVPDVGSCGVYCAGDPWPLPPDGRFVPFAETAADIDYVSSAASSS